MGTEDLRGSFMIGRVFRPGEVTTTCTCQGRMLVLRVQPGAEPPGIPASVTALVGSGTFLERREPGLINRGVPHA